ncbi:MAG: hypothetical protein ACYCY7_11105 [Gallionella sp.]
MEITCYRDTELQREPRQLPAKIYNTAHLLLEHSREGVVFVPIRTMQYLAVIDREEIIFLSGEHKNRVEIAWQNFHPQRRETLTGPVPYDAVYYKPNTNETMRRLHAEFLPALQALSDKGARSSNARIIKLGRTGESG